MRLADEPYLPDDAGQLRWQLTQTLREITAQVNLLSEGYVQAATNAAPAAPTGGAFAVGDFVRNSAPAELGAALSKYVITGWVCTVAGSPGTFLQCRVLTGN
jgi:hypothetical protein